MVSSQRCMMLCMTAGCDLRFCITVSHTVLWRQEILELDIVLSDLGILSEGTIYQILISIAGPDGVMWSKKIIYTPEKKTDGYLPFAANLIKEKISLQCFEQGEYLNCGCSHYRNCRRFRHSCRFKKETRLIDNLTLFQAGAFRFRTAPDI